MLAVTFLSFDVMLTNAKISTAGVKAATQEAQQRTGIELLQQDILESDATVIDLKFAGKFEAKDDKVLLLRQPIFDGSGKVITGQTKYVAYMKGDPGKSNQLVRLEGVRVGAGPLTMKITDVIAEDVDKFEYRLAKTMSVNASLLGLQLPGTVTDSKPSGTKVRVLKIKWPYKNINLENDIQDDGKRGLKTGVVSTTSLQVTTAAVGMVLGSNVPPIDVLYELDEEFSSRADLATPADQIKVWITIKGRDKQPDTNLTASGTMRNTQ